MGYTTVLIRNLLGLIISSCLTYCSSKAIENAKFSKYFNKIISFIIYLLGIIASMEFRRMELLIFIQENDNSQLSEPDNFSDDIEFPYLI